MFDFGADFVQFWLNSRFKLWQKLGNTHPPINFSIVYRYIISIKLQLSSLLFCFPIDMVWALLLAKAIIFFYSWYEYFTWSWSLTYNLHVHGFFNSLFAPIYAGSTVIFYFIFLFLYNAHTYCFWTIIVHVVILVLL